MKQWAIIMKNFSKILLQSLEEHHFGLGTLGLKKMSF
jgi:hypothetical protein